MSEAVDVAEIALAGEDFLSPFAVSPWPLLNFGVTAGCGEI